MSSDLFSKFRRGNNVPTPEGSGADNTSEVFRNRNNYMILANATELTTMIISGVIDDEKGISGTVGGNKITKADISNLVVSRIMGAVDATTGEQK